MVDLTGYKLTFDEEFNTRSISQTGAGTTWADIRAQDRGDANADVGFGHSSFVDKGSGYDPFQVQNGALSITAVPDRTTSGVPGSWESGLLTTQGNFSQTYGYFEVRADFSEQVGAWDAFWLLPNQQKPDPHNAGQHQELDVVERYGDGPSTVYSTIHTTDQTPNIPWQQNRQVTSVMPNQNGYHTYGMDWQADRISFYVDGQMTGSQATPSDLHSPMYLLVDLATQGGGSNNADIARTAITSKIDYVRAYSKDSSAVAVRQDTVSSPDGKDPGLYGATSAAASTPATAANPTPSATTSAAPSSSATGAASATPSPASSSGASSPTTARPRPPARQRPSRRPARRPAPHRGPAPRRPTPPDRRRDPAARRPRPRVPPSRPPRPAPRRARRVRAPAAQRLRPQPRRPARPGARPSRRLRPAPPRTRSARQVRRPAARTR
ncbi:Endo-1,3-1,4-beta-glycanase ExsH [Methylobacterium brachiatum]|nr:Endo-1,3-1,4-beta-glycanase ExsH [Methylobacterium brachiatum]